MLIVDAHLDLAYNAFIYGRDLTQSVAQIRQEEAKRKIKDVATVAIPELQKGGVGLVFGTLFVMPDKVPLTLSTEERVLYANREEAHQKGMAQLDYYHRLADEHERVVLVTDQASLKEVLASQQTKTPLLGIVPLMEGADPIREPEEAAYWYERGLRLIGPAWHDTRYAPGAWRGNEQKLPKLGYRLLEVMASFNFILDVTHLGDQAVYQVLDAYEGSLVATHSNARALVPGMRQLSDDQIRLIGERDGVIGTVFYNRFLRAEHRRGDPKALVTLAHIVAHIDHVCQLLGSAKHVGLGSDMDGGLGLADIPAEIDSSADLPLIGELLLARGYEAKDVANIMGGNWLRILQRRLP